MQNPTNVKIPKEVLKADYQLASRSLSKTMCTLGVVTLFYHIYKYKELVETIELTPEKVAFAIYLVIAVGLILYKYSKVKKYRKQLEDY